MIPKLGFVEWFHIGERRHAEDAADALASMGVGHLRTHLSWADYRAAGGEAWYDWLLPMLSARFEVLPCLHYTPPDLSEDGRTASPPRDLKALADFVDLVCDRYGEHFIWLEALERAEQHPRLGLAAGSRLAQILERMLGGAAYWAQQRGKHVVLPASCPTDLHWLKLMGGARPSQRRRRQSAFMDFLAPGNLSRPGSGVVGPRSCRTSGGRDRSVQRPGGDLGDGNGLLDLASRPSTAIGRVSNAALEAPVSRVYWYGLRDLADDVARAGGPAFRRATLPFRCRPRQWSAETSRSPVEGRRRRGRAVDGDDGGACDRLDETSAHHGRRGFHRCQSWPPPRQ